MDPDKHNAYFGTAEDRSMPMFYNKATSKDGVVMHADIYPKVVCMNEKACMCLNASGKTMCNACLRNTVDNNWKNQHEFNIDCGGKSDNKESIHDGSIYMQSFTNHLNNKNISISVNKPYVPQIKPGYINGRMTANCDVLQTQLIEKSKPSLEIKNNYAADSNFHYGQQQQQQQLRKPMDSCCSNIGTCEGKYPLNDEACRRAKIEYIPYTNTAATLDNKTHDSFIKMESFRQPIAEHVNPSNLLAAKDHASQKYVRKGPPIAASVEHNSCHSHLYVSPPKFSSEKFANAHSTQKLARESVPQQYNPLNSSSSHLVNAHSEAQQRRESPVQLPNPIMSQFSSQSKFSPSHKYQNNPYAVNSTSNTVFYTPSVANVQIPEVKQRLLSQSPARYEYPSSPLPTTPTHLRLPKTMQCAVEGCEKKKGDVFATQEIKNHSLYTNPYKPVKFDQFCTEKIHEYKNKSSIGCNDTSAAFKINRMSSNKGSSSDFDYAPQPIPSSVYSNSSYYYDRNAHGLSSPALATTPTSSLPDASQTNTQLHHNNMYMSQSHHTQSMERYRMQPQSEFSLQSTSSSSSSSSKDVSRLHIAGGLNVQESQLPPTRLNTTQNIQQNSSGRHFSPPAQLIQSTKKSQVKPNYRELINHVYAMRNATSEEELNLQIIKKTLNVDPQAARSSAVSGSVLAQSAMSKVPYRSIQYPQVQPNLSLPALSGSYVHKANVLIDSAADQSTFASSDSVLHEIKQENPCSFSPLDLSMRTIKTKADSTEYSRKAGSFVSSTKPTQRDTKYALPRVEFMPNFSLHSNSRDANVLPNSQATFEKRKLNRSVTSHHHESGDQPPLQSYVNTSTKAHYMNRCEAAPPPAPPLLPSAAENKCKIASNSDNLQTRPSVLEVNPYAQTKTNAMLQKEACMTTASAVVKTSHDSSATQPSKIKYANANIASDTATCPPETKTAYRIACERNPNFLGRKRHLHDYTANIERNQTSLSKKARISESESPAFEEKVDIKYNVEQAKTTEPSVVGMEHFTSTVFDSNKTTALICKQEPSVAISETVAMPLLATVVKAETSLIAARIRTKAELKGFTFDTSSIESSPLKELRIKDEYPANCDASSRKDVAETNKDQSSIIDISWNNACNDFVKQLQSNSKKPSTSAQKLDSSNSNTAAASPAAEKPTSVDVQATNDDSLYTNDSEMNTSAFRNHANDSSMTFKSISQDTTFTPVVIQKKCSKVEREKLRQQQEKRIAARLQRESSSESENEARKRLSQRVKKPLKRGKLRGALVERKHFSDCGSDSTTDDDVDNQKGHETKSTKQKKIVKDLLKIRRLDDKKIIENFTESESANYKIRNNKKLFNVTATADSKKENLVSKSTIECSVIDEEEEKHDDDLSNKVQYGCPNNSDKNVYSKEMNKTSKIIGLNTVTRSKRKRELELQLANSKVLRNDKIIRNSTTKIKRKYVRKFGNVKETSKANANADKEQLMSTRLRSKSENNNKNSNILNNSKCNYNNKKSDAVINKEHQADIFLEVYRYKRALKVPASLISIKHPNNQRISTSLTDFEQDVCDQSASLARKNRIITTTFLTNAAESEKLVTAETNFDEPKSIIDLLHSRVIKSTARPCKGLNAKPTKFNTSNSSIHTHSETSQTTESNSVGLDEAFLTPTKEAATVVNGGKKRHFSIFDTKVLKTKTRTESKLLQKKEIIREIFVGDDRPASAPPEITQPTDGGDKMTYEQKYEQFLQQMNIVIDEEKLRKFGRATTSISSSMLGRNESALKHRDGNAAVNVDKLNSQLQQDNISTASAAPNCFRRRRPVKYLRRKGSSGFDYIRKKKKPSQTPSSSNSLVSNALKAERKEEDAYEGKVKTENDVCREIQKWVLNKGVGQSTMHKAARLGYIDVIVYCLDRMGLNPDQKDNAGYTPLHEACTNGRLEIARVLLQYGANHSEAAHSGIRPLHEASENDNIEIVRMLFSYGADPFLATYSGQTPLMLAASDSMKELINGHLHDVQGLGTPWIFNGPWHIIDDSECGFNTLSGAPPPSSDSSRIPTMDPKNMLKHFISNTSQIVTNTCPVLHNNMNSFTSVGLRNDITVTNSNPDGSSFNQSECSVRNSDSDGEMFEFEEADILLPPLYLLKDEGTDKWVLLSDLCNLLKVKSKDTLLNKIYPSSISTAHKSLIKELKMSDFLEKATCLQLLCAGEKINICASKVVLIKYNDNVRNLLGVKTIFMKF